MGSGISQKIVTNLNTPISLDFKTMGVINRMGFSFNTWDGSIFAMVLETSNKEVIKLMPDISTTGAGFIPNPYGEDQYNHNGWYDFPNGFDEVTIFYTDAGPMYANHWIPNRFICKLKGQVVHDISAPKATNVRTGGPSVTLKAPGVINGFNISVYNFNNQRLYFKFNQAYGISAINGGWTDWSPWSSCVDPCSGKQFRTRTCTNPVPNGGADCVGLAREEKDCWDQECKINTIPKTQDVITPNPNADFSITNEQGMKPVSDNVESDVKQNTPKNAVDVLFEDSVLEGHPNWHLLLAVFVVIVIGVYISRSQFQPQQYQQPQQNQVY